MNSTSVWQVVAAVLAIGNASAQDETARRAAAASASTAAPAPTVAVQLAQSTWIVSETRAPVDYSPVAIATASTADVQLSIQCRVGPSISGQGLALKGDVSRFLMMLPERGEVAFRIVGREGEALEARFALAGLKALHGRMAGPCKWSSN
jgi:hypothetical protein